MAENSKIEWCHATFNPWEGCSKVSPGCAHCYAEARANRFSTVKWGPSATRRIAAEPYWRQPLKWDLEAARAGERRRVFCASLADVFEDRPELVEPRQRLFYLIGDTPHLDWLLLTKRPEVASALVPYYAGRVAARYRDQGLSAEAAAIHRGLCLPNVWLGVSVEDQQRAEERIPQFLHINAKVHFVSYEPALGPVDFRPWLEDKNTGRLLEDGIKLDWIICGGESGAGARPFAIDWARETIQQCKVAGVACFVKQLGTQPYIDHSPEPAATIARKHGIGPLVAEFLALRDRKGGDPAEWPEDLRVRQFPEVAHV